MSMKMVAQELVAVAEMLTAGLSVVDFGEGYGSSSQNSASLLVILGKNSFEDAERLLAELARKIDADLQRVGWEVVSKDVTSSDEHPGFNATVNIRKSAVSRDKAVQIVKRAIGAR